MPRQRPTPLLSERHPPCDTNAAHTSVRPPAPLQVLILVSPPAFPAHHPVSPAFFLPVSPACWLYPESLFRTVTLHRLSWRFAKAAAALLQLQGRQGIVCTLSLLPHVNVHMTVSCLYFFVCVMFYMHAGTRMFAPLCKNCWCDHMSDRVQKTDFTTWMCTS